MRTRPIVEKFCGVNAVWPFFVLPIFLKARGVGIDRHTDGHTPIFGAAHDGHRQAGDALIAAGANVNAASIRGATPIQTALAHGYSPIVDALIAAGANVNAATNYGLTPARVAALRGHNLKFKLRRD